MRNWVAGWCRVVWLAARVVRIEVLLFLGRVRVLVCKWRVVGRSSD